MIEGGLVGVISLPAGVFNPYSPVKTSILIIDKKRSKDCDAIYFIEINTQPGLTSLSLVPEQLKFKKTSFDQMVKNLIECSL